MTTTLASLPWNTSPITDEATWRAYLRLTRGTGVIPEDPSDPDVLNGFLVYADSTGMQVKIKSGTAWMRGVYAPNPAEKTEAIQTAHATLHRIDRVALKLDTVNHTVTIEVVAGTPNASPVAPPLTNTTSIYYVKLAQVYVTAAVTTIAADKVTDERNYSSGGANAITGKYKCFLAYVDAGTLSVGAGELTINRVLYSRSAAFNITFANLDTGAEGAGKNYYVYAVPGGAGQFDAVISLSASAPTGYGSYSLIGWFHNNGSSSILRYSVASARFDEDTDYPEKGPKPGMVQFPGASWMIDIYIASNSGGTGKAIHAGNAAASAYNATPWVSLTYFAQYKACMNAGKRLCSNEEWSMAAFGTPPGANNNTNCWTAAANTVSNPTGILPNCVSTLGCYDMTGNVWERVATWSMITDVAADQSGWAWTNQAGTWTNEAEGGEANTAFGVNAGSDGNQGPRALVRGGGWGTSVNAGGWAVYGADSPRNALSLFGFRCCS